jgi:hypothetical protein
MSKFAYVCLHVNEEKCLCFVDAIHLLDMKVIKILATITAITITLYHYYEYIVF